MQEAAATPAPEPPPKAAETPDYPLSEVRQPPSSRCSSGSANWARQLKYGQFRLFLALAQLMEDDPHHGKPG
jgi:hypothetical protein